MLRYLPSLTPTLIKNPFQVAEAEADSKEISCVKERKYFSYIASYYQVHSLYTLCIHLAMTKYQLMNCLGEDFWLLCY